MTTQIWRFSECEFDEQRLELRVRGVVTRVEAKPLELLRQLLLRAGEVVTREELLDTVWPGLTVVDGSVATAVSKLRKALGDDRLIVTVPRLGYRLSVPVHTVSVETPVPARIEPPAAMLPGSDANVPLTEAAPPESSPRRRWVFMSAATVLAAAIVALLQATWTAPGRSLKTVAVLPFANFGAGAESDYLGIALADESATILTHARNVAVRPVTMMYRTLQAGDVTAAGRELEVGTVVTGHYVDVMGRLAITLEAIDVSSGALLWRDSFDAPHGDMLAMQVQLALRIGGGLTRALGTTAITSRIDPSSPEGYALFLRATALSTDPAPNLEAIALLRRSVALDDRYPPAWQALSKRYYIEARYGNGSDTVDVLREAELTAGRAVELDPEYVPPAAGLVIMRVERGELQNAYMRAADLVQRRPDSVDTQFALSYVYRYAGLLEESARHCEEGFLLDARNRTSGLRSCAVVFLHRGDYVRTANYLHLDEGSEFERGLTLHMLVRQGRVADAAQLDAATLPRWGSWRLLSACVRHRPDVEVAALTGGMASDVDAETSYFAATHLSYCGQSARAAAALKQAIDGGYCSLPAIDVDPLLASLRATPQYAGLRSAAAACQREFVSRVQ